MSEVSAEYVVVQQVHVNRWYEDLQRGIPGWEYTVRDNLTGVSVPVFVPDSQRTVQNVERIIANELAIVRGVHQLGQ